MAWEEEIVLNVVLFSFEMACSANNTQGGQIHRGEEFNQMLNNNSDSYIDNVLSPLVSGLKDHPALFAWEIFNEADGMTVGTNFFSDHCPNGAYPQELQTLQSFVNKSSAKIRELDPNVKVTSSVSQTARLDQYSNASLTSIPNADPNGTLDFYQAHWYWIYDHSSNPYEISASARGMDRPIVIGEFSYGEEPVSGTTNNQLSNALLNNGYAGAWIWDQNGLTNAQINTVISGASGYSPTINKVAIEQCISTQDTSCYNDGSGTPPPPPPPPPGEVTIYQGTPGPDVFPGLLTGQADYFGGDSYDQVDYQGSLSDYNFELQANDRVFVYKSDGGYDVLDSIEGIWFIAEEAWYSINDALTGSPPPSTLTAGDIDVFVFAGQSNADGHFYNADGNNSLPTGKEVFEAQVLANSGFTTQALNVSVGSSASNENSDQLGLYWWDIANNQPGPLLTNAVNTINQSLFAGENVDGIIWAQGETDSFSVLYSNSNYAATVEADFVNATTNIFAHFRAQFGADLPIYVQEIGYFMAPDDATSSFNGFDVIRNAQQGIIDAEDKTFLAAQTSGLGQRDDVHFNTEAYGTIATGLANTAYATISSNP